MAVAWSAVGWGLLRGREGTASALVATAKAPAPCVSVTCGAVRGGGLEIVQVLALPARPELVHLGMEQEEKGVARCIVLEQLVACGLQIRDRLVVLGIDALIS